MRFMNVLRVFAMFRALGIITAKMHQSPLFFSTILKQGTANENAANVGSSKGSDQQGIWTVDLFRSDMLRFYSAWLCPCA